jgi:hypothetical protein
MTGLCWCENEIHRHYDDASLHGETFAQRNNTMLPQHCLMSTGTTGAQAAGDPARRILRFCWLWYGVCLISWGAKVVFYMKNKQACSHTMLKGRHKEAGV